jgi:integrase
VGVRHVRIPVADAVKKYLRHFAKRNRPASLKRYDNALSNVLSFIGGELPLGALNPKMLQDYQLERIITADAKTVDYEVDVFRTFLNWCEKRHWVHDNIADGEHVDRLVRKSKRQKADKRIFTNEELEVLLSPNEKEYWQLYYVFNTFYFSGIRIAELATSPLKTSI